MKDQDRLAWLSSARGISEETARRVALGWNTKDWHLSRGEWGLPEDIKEDGSPRQLWIPAGLVIPTRNRFGTVVKLNLRRPDGQPRYACIEGGNMAPLLIGDGKAGAVVVESDLDALLIAQEAGDLVTAVSLGSAANRPDMETHRLLTDGRAVLLALDSDSAGGKASWGFWKKQYPHAVRWPVPMGKDPTEGWKAGFQVRAWVADGLREAFRVESESVPTESPEPYPPEGHPAPILQPAAAISTACQVAETAGAWSPTWLKISGLVDGALEAERAGDAAKVDEALKALRLVAEGGG